MTTKLFPLMLLASAGLFASCGDDSKAKGAEDAMEEAADETKDAAEEGEEAAEDMKEE